MDPTKLLDWVKLPTKTLAALCLVSGILIFVSDSTLDKFGLEVLVADYRAYFGIAFLVTLALTSVNSLSVFFRFIKPWIAEAYWVHFGKKRLQNLNPTEKEILSYYIQNQTRSQRLRYQDGTVNGLQKEKIIIRASSIGSMSGFDYNIQPWAWEYLNKNPELLN